MTAAHLFVADLDHPEVDERDRHHLQRVLRLRAGEVVTVSDGAGRVRECTIDAGLTLTPAGAVVFEPAPEPSIAVGFALVKSERPEWIVQKLTECGVDRIVPYIASRSVVRWEDDKAARNVERWRTIAREAAMQSRRARLPVVDDVHPFADLVSAPGVALADADGEPPTVDDRFVLVGPEGGWTDAERSAVARHVRLGSHVFRTETAAIAAGVMLTALRAGLIDGAKRGV